jgi:eukaryotic-like serine/threonine-protein kinase
VLLKRFEQEFRSTSNLCHPNIIRGLEFGWAGEQPYMVMELVDGEDLWNRIERLGRLAEAEAVGYIVQVARGLHEAHKHGIIHRDIKPDNILLTVDGQAKLADLGLSKDLEDDLELTRPDRGLGTPNFIAPEQFADAKHAGVRCDIYSLGATLYMALTGQLPFNERGMATILKKKLANDLPSPRQLVPSVHEHVDWAVRRAVMADPERRFASCPEFIAALT